MNFGDFVEKMEETPICCELKQVLDKWYEFYIKDPEKCMEVMLTLQAALKAAEECLEKAKEE